MRRDLTQGEELDEVVGSKTSNVSCDWHLIFYHFSTYSHKTVSSTLSLIFVVWLAVRL